MQLVDSPLDVHRGGRLVRGHREDLTRRTDEQLVLTDGALIVHSFAGDHVGGLDDGQDARVVHEGVGDRVVRQEPATGVEDALHDPSVRRMAGGRQGIASRARVG